MQTNSRHTHAVADKDLGALGDGHVDGHRDPLLLRVEDEIEAAGEIVPAVGAEGGLEVGEPPGPGIRKNIDAGEGGVGVGGADVVEAEDDLGDGGETVGEVVGVEVGWGGVPGRRDEAVGEAWELVEADVGHVPAGETGAVALVVAAAEVDGEETWEGGGGVEEGVGGGGVEEVEVAKDAGEGEGRPGEEGEWWGGGEGGPEGEEAQAAEETGMEVNK